MNFKYGYRVKTPTGYGLIVDTGLGTSLVTNNSGAPKWWNNGDLELVDSVCFTNTYVLTTNSSWELQEQLKQSLMAHPNYYIDSINSIYVNNEVWVVVVYRRE